MVRVRGEGRRDSGESEEENRQEIRTRGRRIREQIFRRRTAKRSSREGGEERNKEVQEGGRRRKEREFQK